MTVEAGTRIRPVAVPTRWNAAIVRLTLVAAVLSLGHHLDHVIRGNHVGWPLTSQVNAFTCSLAIYPAIGIGLLLYRSGRVGPGFWALLSGGGAVFLALIHFGPLAIEPPSHIIDLYEPPILGWSAFGWLLVFVAVLALTCFIELRQWHRDAVRMRSSHDHTNCLPSTKESKAAWVLRRRRQR